MLYSNLVELDRECLDIKQNEGINCPLCKAIRNLQAPGTLLDLIALQFLPWSKSYIGLVRK